MKRSFSLLETIISVMLLSVTILTLLKLKDNNLFILSTSDQRASYDGYISIHSSSSEQTDETINFKNYIDLSDDKLRKKLKDQKIEYKHQLSDSIELSYKTMDIKLNIYKESYKSKESGNKEFFRVTLNE